MLLRHLNARVCHLSFEEREREGEAANNYQKDYFGMIQFDDKAEVVQNMTLFEECDLPRLKIKILGVSCTTYSSLYLDTANITPKGGTNLHYAMTQAQLMMERHMERSSVDTVECDNR